MVAEIDEGTACLDCGEACEGFTPHEWKYVLFLGFNIILLFFCLFIGIFAITAVVHANVMI